MRWFGLALILVVTGCASPQIPESPEPSLRSSPDSPSQMESAEQSASLETPSPVGISRKEAVEIALEALQGETWAVVRADAGPLAQLRPDWSTYEWGKDLPANVRVWRVGLVSGELGGEVVIDFAAGSIYSAILGIAN
jgi:hypothetical protein